jgi:hypothetical protein
VLFIGDKMLGMKGRKESKNEESSGDKRQEKVGQLVEKGEGFVKSGGVGNRREKFMDKRQHRRKQPKTQN